jgi:hypothetical protein
MNIYRCAIILIVIYIIGHLSLLISSWLGFNFTVATYRLFNLILSIFFAVAFASLIAILQFFKEKRYYQVFLMIYLFFLSIIAILIYWNADRDIIKYISLFNAINYTIFIVSVFRIKSSEVSGLFRFLGITMIIALVGRMLIPILIAWLEIPQLDIINVLVSLLPVLVILGLNYKMQTVDKVQL